MSQMTEEQFTRELLLLCDRAQESVGVAFIITMLREVAERAEESVKPQADG